MKKFKSFIAVLLCLAAVFCTAGCSASKKSALNISGAQIDYETFLYYFDQVHAFPEKYELAADATNEQMIDAAIELCCEYVAVNTKLSEYGLTLSSSESARLRIILKTFGMFSRATMRSSACRSRRS